MLRIRCTPSRRSRTGAHSSCRLHDRPQQPCKSTPSVVGASITCPRLATERSCLTRRDGFRISTRGECRLIKLGYRNVLHSAGRRLHFPMILSSSMGGNLSLTKERKNVTSRFTDATIIRSSRRSFDTTMRSRTRGCSLQSGTGRNIKET